ncbi:hypothetical protein DWB61_15030 [Ancylomarina euxinus]|uniref:Uncharacterized protein n=1 Tax=Ancylomarina euxinus TaxID=2283627 RepID=A0A425XXR5_9BACT|nr:hypothetical protein [Ancylomarina euxinus]MCZ4696030.1 hypothetical protein [Ancylomarina euxinus]MUP13969.1 hypothetical protein [Ancylomarina euxinus]RRG19523.1 hypothetical protein DWB61_15030 [Ancylomarina euxinus]
MTKRKALIVSAVFIGSALLVEVLKMNYKELLDGEFVDFLSGALLGSGIGLFLGNILRKEKIC